MPGPSVYVETSVWGSLAPRQPRDRKQFVQRLLRLLDGVYGTCVISETVIEEIDLAPFTHRGIIKRAVEESLAIVLATTDEIEALARAYISAKVLPPRRLSDALHVASATCFGLDFLVSWNHRHLTRPTKKLQFETVNRFHRYLKTPTICNPAEMCDELGR